MSDPITQYLQKHGGAAPTDTAADDPVSAYLQKHGAPTTPPPAAQPTPAPHSMGEDAAGFGRALGQGLTFGFGDEIEAGLRAPFSDRTYGQIRDDVRGQQKDYATRHPGWNATGEIIGGLATAAIPIAGEANAARALTTAGRVGRALTVGAGTGALYGLGKGEGGVAQQAASTVVGGVLGAGLGAASQGALEGGARLLSRATETPALRALRLGVTDAGRAGKTTAQMRQEYTPNKTVADALGRPGQERLDWAISVPNAKEADAATFLTNRAAGRGTRIQQGVEDALGASRGDVVADEATMHAARSAAAKTNYGAAYQETVPVQIFDRLLRIKGTNPFARAYEHGRASASIEGVDVPAWAQIEDAFRDPRLTALHEVPVQALDYMQRGIGKLVRRGGESDFAIDRTDARNMYAALKDVMQQGDAHAPAFAKARQAFADASESIDALDAGQRALRSKPAQITQDLGALSPPAQQRYRQGVAEDTWSRVLGRDPTGGRALRYLSAPESQAAFDAAAPSPAHGAALKALVGSEDTMAQTENTALQNSASVRRLQMARESEGSGPDMLQSTPAQAGMALATGRPLAALQAVLGKGAQRYQQARNGGTASEVIDLYLGGRGGQPDYERALALMDQYPALAALFRSPTGRALPLTAGAASGNVGGRIGARLTASGGR